METLKHGIQPFWFWNGAIDEGEIRRQIGEMKSQGFQGFFIHPRQGMEIPYLSKPFFERVKVAIGAAKEHRMEVWLYDEFPYPSGISGGRVTLDHPEYACTELTKTCQVFQGGETARLSGPWGKVLMARAYRMKNETCCWEDYVDLTDYVGSGYRQDVFQMSGLTQYNKKRYFQGDLGQLLCWEVPAGRWKIYLYTEAVMKNFKYFEYFIDPLNPEAVRYFLETTHERYKEYVGDEFGKTIRGVFTDEVTAFPPFHPWSPLLPGLVKSMSGLDLISHLPALSEDMGEITHKIRYAYWNAATEQFIASWEQQVYQWCDENNLIYTGEKPILRSKELQFTHIPGIDAGHQKFGCRAVLAADKYRANGKIVSSAAHFYGKPAAICEAFHSIGWGMTLQDAKWIFDWLTVMGIDWFATHGAYYTTDALKKHDAPPSFFYQMPWWRNTHELSSYVEKLNHFLMDGRRKVQVLLLDPVTSTWTEIEERLKKLNEDFAAFQNMLLRSGVDYYVMDPQLFANGRVEMTDGRGCYVNCGDCYQMIVLPFMTNLETAAVKMLQKYAEAGGVILAAGTLPFRNLEGYHYEEWTAKQFGVAPEHAYKAYFSDSRELCSVDGSCYFAADYREAARTLHDWEWEKRTWQVLTPDTDEILQVQSTGNDGREKLFLVNLGQEQGQADVRFGTARILLELTGGASVFLDENDMREGCREQRKQLAVLTVDTSETMAVQAEGVNALRIGTWQMELPDQQNGEVDSFPLIDQLEGAGMKIPVCQRDYFGCPKELAFPEIKARFLYRFVNRLEQGDAPSPAPGKRWENRIYLVMEPGTLLGEWSIRLNEAVYGAGDFLSYPVYLPANLAVDVTNAICDGENYLELQIHAQESFGGIRNPLYLYGDFGVFFENGQAVLETVKAVGCIKDLTGCGLPYFAGTVQFTKTLSEAEEWLNDKGDEEPVCIRLQDKYFHDALHLKLGEQNIGVCAYAPYEFTVTAGALKEHRKMVFSLDTSLSRLFEGEYFDEVAHRYRRVDQETGVPDN